MSGLVDLRIDAGARTSPAASMTPSRVMFSVTSSVRTFDLRRLVRPFPFTPEPETDEAMHGYTARLAGA